ncbi:MAG: cytochrome c oxidase assembly factor Coa1 family protein [Sulfuriferula sp.]|nr:cytochrome c oxidase assembly factor Coa1 family protein [Sulfuriferula sp.]
MRLLKKILLAGLLGVALYVGVYVYALHSDGFKFVQRTIEESPSIQREFGRPVRVSLSLFGAFKEKHVDSDELVSMSINVDGVTRSARITVRASRKDGIWKIESASADGAPVTIE